MLNGIQAHLQSSQTFIKKTILPLQKIVRLALVQSFQAIPIEVAFLYVVDFLALPHHLFRWVGYMKTRGNQMILLAIPWRYDSKLPTTISKRENENPRLFVAGCSVFDLKTLISEANQQSSPTSTLLSWQTSATLNRCLGGCQVLIPFLLVDWSASANAFEDISCFDLLPQQGF